jgi:hypothetical protein
MKQLAVQYKQDKEKGTKMSPKRLSISPNKLTSPKINKISPSRAVKGGVKHDIWDLTSDDCDELSLSGLRL